jgi:hypothetical protein
VYYWEPDREEDKQFFDLKNSYGLGINTTLLNCGWQYSTVCESR